MASTSTSTEIENMGEYSVLQKHVAFFDMNHDGVVYPWETFEGLRAIGCGRALSFAAALFINIALSSKTRPGKYPNLLFPVVIQNIHMAKHGSDSDVYDSQGRFVPEKFEEIFTKHALTNPNALTSDEFSGMLKANRDAKDYKGWVVAWSEWKLLYMLGKDENGLLEKETIKSVYDGTVFEMLEKKRSSSQKKP